MKHEGDRLGLYFYCEQEQETDWLIETHAEMKIKAVGGATYSDSCEVVVFEGSNKLKGWGLHNFILWRDLLKDYVVDDTLKVETHVKILKMIGIEKEGVDFSDLALVVEGQKFHVSKTMLAYHSPYFKDLFLRTPDEPEITLDAQVNAQDFQNFLSLLYGENPIDDSTVEGITHLADMYDAKLAIQKCEEFSIGNPEKSLKEKLQLAHRYNLKNLKNSCLSRINTESEIRSVFAFEFSEMDPLGALLHKMLDHHDKFKTFALVGLFLCGYVCFCCCFWRF